MCDICGGGGNSPCLQTWLSFADLQSATFHTPKLWTKDGSKSKSLTDHITDYQNNSVTQSSCRTNSLTECLRHAKWNGAMARSEQGACVQSPDPWQVLFGHCLFPHDAGACPWLVCMLKNCWGFGPNGLGEFARSHNSTGVVLQLLLVGQLTECGIVALTDLAKCLETDTGMSLAAKHLVLLPLEPGTVAWVPYGYVCIPSALQTQQSKTTADMVHEVAFMSHLTIFNKRFLHELPETVWAAIQAFNNQHLSRAASKPVWASRKDIFTRFALLKNFVALAIFKSPRYEEEEFTRFESVERRRAIFWPCVRVRTGHGVACAATNARNTDTRDAVEKKMKANEMLRMFVVVPSKYMYVFTMKYIICSTT